MKRLVGNEIPPVEIAFYRDERGRVHMEIVCEHTNPIVLYNTTVLTRAHPGSPVLPIHNQSLGGGGRGGNSVSGSGGVAAVVYGGGCGSGGNTGAYGGGSGVASSDQLWGEDQAPENKERVLGGYEITKI